jgi:hypothetical protein
MKRKVSIQEKILYVLGGISLLGGGLYFGKRFFQKQVANQEEKKSLDDGSSATYAKRIKMAFDNDGWWGTDTEQLRSVLREIPTKEEFQKVVASYQKLYNSNMAKDMSDELQSTEYNEMLSIIAAKPEKAGVKVSFDYSGWAKRLKAAFDKTYGFMPGTDEEAIMAVFTEIPTQAAYVEVGKAYQRLYGSSLTEDLKGELEFWEYDDYMKIITSKKKQ